MVGQALEEIAVVGAVGPGGELEAGRVTRQEALVQASVPLAAELGLPYSFVCDISYGRRRCNQ